MSGSVLAFCSADTRTQIAESVAAGHGRGHAPSEEERVRRRLDAARHLLRHGDEAQRRLAVKILWRIREGRS